MVYTNKKPQGINVRSSRDLQLDLGMSPPAFFENGIPPKIGIK